jgi:hypothetical protein
MLTQDSGWDNWRVDLDGKPVHGDDVDYHKVNITVTPL